MKGKILLAVFLAVLLFVTITQAFIVIQPTPKDKYPIGDINKDCIVNRTDMYLVVECFGVEKGRGWNKCKIADLNNDGIIDILDLYIVRLHYGEKCLEFCGLNWTAWGNQDCWCPKFMTKEIKCGRDPNCGMICPTYCYYYKRCVF